MKNTHMCFILYGETLSIFSFLASVFANMSVFKLVGHENNVKTVTWIFLYHFTFTIFLEKSKCVFCGPMLQGMN